MNSQTNRFYDQPRKLVIHDRAKYHRNLRNDFAKKAQRQTKPAPDNSLIGEMRMTRQAYTDIEGTIGKRPAESGGILLSDTYDYTITCMVFDIAASQNTTVYQPNTAFLNSVLKGRNDQFVGIVHSHTAGYGRLSGQDQNAAWSNITSPGNPHLQAYLMPIVQTIPDTGRFEIIPYIVTCHPAGKGRVIVKKVNLKIID